jgi:hypothetical protein
VRALALLIVLCDCASPRDASLPPPCLHPLLEYVGTSARGGAIYREYGWSRDGLYHASLDSALRDRPELLARLHRADDEDTAGGWTMLAGLLGTFAGSAAALWTAPGVAPAALGTIAVGAAGLVVGGAVYAHGRRSWAAALASFNADATQQGCRPPAVR